MSFIAPRGFGPDATIVSIVVRGYSIAVALLAEDVTSATTVSQPAIGQKHVLLANDLVSASTVSTPATGLGKARASIVTRGYGADATIGGIVVRGYAPSNTANLLANDLVSATSVDAPAIGQKHLLLADDLTSASTVSEPALGQVHALLANDLASTSSLSSPTAGEEYTSVNPLSANDISSAPFVGTPSLGQIHALLAASPIVVQPFLSVPALKMKKFALSTPISRPHRWVPTLSSIGHTFAYEFAYVPFLDEDGHTFLLEDGTEFPLE